jgi:sugar fermentation stimulation protein A
MAWFYPYPPLLEGRLIKRYKRFFADIELANGTTITAHCPNTGPMTGVCQIGGRVMVSESQDPKRKLAYTWELAEVNDTIPTWAGVNTALPNRVVRAALEARLFPELGEYSEIRSEVTYGSDKKSRVDFVVSSLQDAAQSKNDREEINREGIIKPGTKSIYIEVKNTTWAQGNLALFPDTVTTRGQKHLRELTQIMPQFRSVMLYFINRGDCTAFAPGDSADPDYGNLLRLAQAQGLEILPCRFQIEPSGITYLGLAEASW